MDKLTSPMPGKEILRGAEQHAELKTQNAIYELKALQQTITSVIKDIEDRNSHWWENGVNTQKANSALIQAAQAQAQLSSLRDLLLKV